MLLTRRTRKTKAKWNHLVGMTRRWKYYGKCRNTSYVCQKNSYAKVSEQITPVYRVLMFLSSFSKKRQNIVVCCSTFSIMIWSKWRALSRFSLQKNLYLVYSWQATTSVETSFTKTGKVRKIWTYLTIFIWLH